MIRNSVTLFRVAGISVGVHVSWLIIFGLVTWSLATGFLPAMLPDISSGEAWLIGAVSAVLLFASVLLHELAHSLVALRRGLKVQSITLFLFGGVSNLTAESRDPRTEFTVAIVGPLTSFAIAAAAFLIAIPLDALPEVQVIFVYLAVVNVLLGGFNLVPGFPLDGGRVLRSIVWQATGNLRRATEIASTIGQLLGYSFILWGGYQLFNGDLLGGLWIAAIGWFLQGAAANSVQQLVFEGRLRGIRVRDVLRADATSVPPGLTADDLIEDFMLRDNRRAIPVADNGRLVGIVTLGDLHDVTREKRGGVTVAQIMGGRDGLVTTAPGSTLLDAAQTLASHDFDQLPVVENGRILGLLTRADIVRVLQVREALAPGDADPAGPDAPAGSDAAVAARGRP